MFGFIRFISVYNCGGSCNTGDPYPQICIPNRLKKGKVKVFSLMSDGNENWYAKCLDETIYMSVLIKDVELLEVIVYSIWDKVRNLMEKKAFNSKPVHDENIEKLKNFMMVK